MRKCRHRHQMICRRERGPSDRRFSRPLGCGHQPAAQRVRVSGQAAGAGADQFQGAAKPALGEGGPVLMGSHKGRQGDHPSQRKCPGTSPASPPRMRAVWDERRPLQPPFRRPGAMHLSWRAKRLRFRRHRVAALPHHCRPQGFPRPPCPSPGNRTRGGGRRHGASDTPRQRER